jgi:hypothetical protein
MILQILLPRLVAQHHSESAPRIHVDGSLQIQFVERNHVRDGFIAALLNHGEMYVPVHKPVVDRTIHCRHSDRARLARVLLRHRGKQGSRTAAG